MAPGSARSRSESSSDPPLILRAAGPTPCGMNNSRSLIALVALVLLAGCDRSEPIATPVVSAAEQAQLDRRAVTTTRVELAGFEVLLAPHWMPPASLDVRPPMEIADRAIASMLTAIKGERGEQSLVDDGIAAFGERAVFSSLEQDFIINEQPDMQARADYSWRFECVHVLLWSLGYVDELHAANTAADIGSEVTLIQEAGAAFGEDAQPRTADEILAEADYYEGLLGASRQVRNAGRELPTSVSYSIVYERTRAFRWLVRFADTWDEISLAGVAIE